MHAVEACRQGERGDLLDVVERVIADIPHALAQAQRRHQAVAGKGVVADAGHGRHRHARQLGTFFERIGTNRCHSGIKRYVGEVWELLEHAGVHHSALATHGKVDKGLLQRAATGGAVGVSGEGSTQVQGVQRHIGDYHASVGIGAVDGERLIAVLKGECADGRRCAQAVEDIVGNRLHRGWNGQALDSGGVIQGSCAEKFQLIVKINVFDGVRIIAKQLSGDTHHMVGHSFDNNICRHKHEVALARRVRRVDASQCGDLQQRAILVMVIRAGFIGNGGVVIG